MEDQLVSTLVKSLLENSSEWSFTPNTAIHQNGTKLWLANGFFFLGVYEPCEIGLSLRNKLILTAAIKKCKINLTLNNFK